MLQTKRVQFLLSPIYAVQADDGHWRLLCSANVDAVGYNYDSILISHAQRLSNLLTVFVIFLVSCLVRQFLAHFKCCD